MNVSEAMKLLAHIHKEHGDLELATLVVSDGGFLIDYGKTFEVVTPVCKHSKMEPICAFMFPLDETPINTTIN